MCQPAEPPVMTQALAGAPAPTWRFPIGLAGGLVATLWMTAVMRYLPEGETPPTVAAGVLTETHPDDAPRRLATVAHYLAGAGTGLLFVWLSLLVETVFDASVAAAVVAAVALFALMTGFFILVPLPRSGLSGARRRHTARDWLIAAGAYLLALVPVVVALTAALG